MDLITVDEVAEILKASKWFVYQNARLFGGFKIGGVLRFDKATVTEVINDRIKASREVALGLLEERGEAQEKRIPHQARSKGSGNGSQKKSTQDKYGFHKLVREKTGRPGSKKKS